MRCGTGDAFTEDHWVAVDDQLVDLTQQLSGQHRAAAQPDAPARLLLQPADELHRVAGNNVDVGAGCSRDEENTYCRR